VSASSVAWVDWALLALLGLSMLLGIVRGLSCEVMSLLGWVVAYFAAQALSANVAPAITVSYPGSALNAAVAFVAVFVAVLIGWGVLSWLIRHLVQASPLNALDRALGALFGVLRGVLLALAVAITVNMTPLSDDPSWRSSRGAEGLDLVLAGLKPLLPEPISRHLRTVGAAVRTGA
jgi:membrane protein required for colicin V production